MADTTAGQQTVQHSVQQPCRSLPLSRATQTGILNRLGRECCHSHLVASLGESWDRDPGALWWRLRSLGISIFGLLFIKRERRVWEITSRMLGIMGRA